MRFGQLIRLLRGAKTGSPLSAPIVSVNPQIFSATPGVYKVGVLLSVSPAVASPAPLFTNYQWMSGLTEISGATTAFYLPVAADVASNLKCRIQLVGAGDTTTVYTTEVGPILAATVGGDPETPPPGLETALAGVDAATLSRRATVIAEMADCWPGYEGQAFASDQVVTGSTALSNAFAALDTSDLSQWHRIRLDSTAAASGWAVDVSLKGTSYNTTTGIPLVANRDRATYGGGVLIESTDPNNPVLVTGLIGSAQAAFTMNGVRGVHLRRFRVGKFAQIPTNTSRDAAVCIRSQRTSSYAQLSVVRVEECGIGSAFNPSAPVDGLSSGVGFIQTGAHEQIDIINNVFKACQTSISLSGCRFVRRWGNDFQGNIGDASIILHTTKFAYTGVSSVYGAVDKGWDERSIIWTRMNTVRNLLDSELISNQHTDPIQFGTSGDIGGYTELVEFEVYLGNRVKCTDVRRFTFTGVPTEGATLTISGVVFTYRNAPTLPEDIQIGVSISATASSARTKIEAYGIPYLVQALPQGTTQLDLHFSQGHIGTVSSTALGSWSAVRIGGGTQGVYVDDTKAPYTHEVTAICSIIAGSSVDLTFWNGTGVGDRLTLVRAGALVPDASVAGGDGFEYSATDVDGYANSSRISTAVTADHTFRNCVVGKVVDKINGLVERTTNGVFTGSGSVLTLSGCIFAKWKTSVKTADVLLNGPFTSDAQGRIAYSVQSDGLNSQAAFRAQMYSVLKLANVTDRASVGTTDPATWV